jgi:hypothetical protein
MKGNKCRRFSRRVEVNDGTGHDESAVYEPNLTILIELQKVYSMPHRPHACFDQKTRLLKLVWIIMGICEHRYSGALRELLWKGIKALQAGKDLTRG